MQNHRSLPTTLFGEPLRDALPRYGAGSLGLTGVDRLQRRLRRWGVVLWLWGLPLTAAAILGWALRQVDGALGPVAWVSGWTLVACVAGLMLLALRKRFRSAWLGGVRFWQQTHHSLGLFALLVLGLHVGWPTGGWFESGLLALFLIVSGSGLISWLMNRTTPKRLLAVQPALVFEAIEPERQRVAGEAYQLALRAAQSPGSACLGEYYRGRLERFFTAPRGWLYRLSPTGRLRRSLLDGLRRQHRYLDESGRLLADQLAMQIRARDDLDFQWALQWRLKSWALAHRSLTWTLVVMIAAHVWLVWRFHG
jgi:hypothetical protein